MGIGTVLFAVTVGPNAQFWLERLDLGHPPGFEPVVHLDGPHPTDAPTWSPTSPSRAAEPDRSSGRVDRAGLEGGHVVAGPAGQGGEDRVLAAHDVVGPVGDEVGPVGVGEDVEAVAS